MSVSGKHAGDDSMIQFHKALSAWGTPGFGDILKREIELLGADRLPLQQGLSISSHVTAEPITVMINNIAESEGVIRVRAGILYSGVIGGCSCADDPTPVSENTEYCEIRLDIDKATAETRVTLVTE